MKLKAVIGLSGKPGAGKATLTGMIRKSLYDNGIGVNPTVIETGTGGILAKVAKELGILPDRSNLQKLPDLLKQALRQIDPEWTLAKVVGNKIREDEFSQLIVVDAIRLPEDVAMMKGLPVSNFIWSVGADFDKRLERIRLRKRLSETDLSREKFLEQDNAETESHTDWIRSQADLVIDNNGGEEETQKQVNQFILENIVTLFRKNETPQ